MKIVPSKLQEPEPIKLLGRHQKLRKQCINTEHSYIVNKWSTFHTFTIYWSLWEIIAACPPVDLCFVPMPACTALPPNANFGLSDWS